jgi:hypothetical protein
MGKRRQAQTSPGDHFTERRGVKAPVPQQTKDAENMDQCSREIPDHRQGARTIGRWRKILAMAGDQTTCKTSVGHTDLDKDRASCREQRKVPP